MTKRFITLIAALLVLGFVVAGCGDDESDSAGGGGDTAAQTDTATDTATGDDTATEGETATGDETATDETATAEDGGATAPRNLEQAVENCKRGVNAAQQLSADAKDKLQDICETAASGDDSDIRKAAHEVCTTIIEDTFPKGTPGREQALESCDRQ